jgi:replicative DNA helicase
MNKKEEIPLEKILPADVKPPAAIESERMIIGGILYDNIGAMKAFEILEPSTFYLKPHQILFEMMLSLYERGIIIDMISLYNEAQLRQVQEKIGGAIYLSNLSNQVSSAANIEYHCNVIREKKMLRDVISISHSLARKAYENTEDVFDLVEEAQTKFSQVSEVKKDNVYHVRDSIRETLEVIEDLQSGKRTDYMIPTPFYDLNHLIGGFKRGDFYILAARPSQGKTGMALDFAVSAAKEHQVLLYSLEMARLQIDVRLISKLGGHPLDKLLSTEKITETHRISRGAMKVTDLNLWVDDASSQTINQIRSKSNRMKLRDGLDMIIIDYIQLMRGRRNEENREREISEISRGLKALAKELDVPVLALAQLNRAVETRAIKKPVLSDLRESGSLEQDSDCVMFIYRPEYYGVKKDENDEDCENKAFLIIAKQRNGPTGEVQLYFKKETASFDNRLTKYESIQEDIF